MVELPRHVLFLCTGNSARSILAEALLRGLGGERFRASSAGSRPAGRVHPEALACLERHGHATAGLRSKGWDELAGPGAAPVDLVITVCAAAAGETCPVWPGTPLRAHWGLPDPAACEGSAAVRRAAFEETYRALEHRIRRLVALPFASLDAEASSRELAAIAEAPAPEGD